MSMHAQQMLLKPEALDNTRPPPTPNAEGEMTPRPPTHTGTPPPNLAESQFLICVLRSESMDCSCCCVC